MRNYPALKPGVTYVIEHHSNYSSIAVGTSNFGIRLNGHAAILFIQKTNGQIELNDLINEVGITNGQALEILQPLLTHNLISLLTSPALVDNEGIKDYARKVAIARAIPELNTIGWRNNINPYRELLSRAKNEITLLGSNRLTFALFELFLASGYTKTKISESSFEGRGGCTFNDNKIDSKANGSHLIGANLIGATPFRMSDIGQPLKSANENIYRESTLRTSQLHNEKKEVDSSSNSEPNSITINTQEFQPDQIIDLTLDKTPHLQIGNLTSGKVEIGPIVIPGKTPCYNCIALWKSEKMKDLARLKVAHDVAAPLELPAASVRYLAGLIVSLVDNYFALNKSFLIGSSVVMNLLKPLEFTERFWQPSPLCGCLELL